MVNHGRLRPPDGTGPRGYAVVVEGRPGAYGAWVPQLDGCVAVGATVPEVERLIEEAIELHLASLRAYGERVPRPTGVSTAIVRPTAPARPAAARTRASPPVHA